jgi:TetR/AcrR family transcriptional regulator, transcriptional repressor for nem operon
MISLMSTTPRTARGRATRERILQAATDLISERGVAGTSLDDVRELARASKSQLYLYFPDRDALLREVAGLTCDTVIGSQAEVLAAFSSLEGLERYLDAIVGLQVERETPTGCPIASLAGQLADHDEQTRLILADGLGRWELGLREGLEAMAARGELKPDADPSRLATQTLTILQGGLLLTQVRRDAGQMRIAADTVLTVVRAALV